MANVRGWGYTQGPTGSPFVANTIANHQGATTQWVNSSANGPRWSYNMSWVNPDGRQVASPEWTVTSSVTVARTRCRYSYRASRYVYEPWAELTRDPYAVGYEWDFTIGGRRVAYVESQRVRFFTAPWWVAEDYDTDYYALTAENPTLPGLNVQLTGQLHVYPRIAHMLQTFHSIPHGDWQEIEFYWHSAPSTDQAMVVPGGPFLGSVPIQAGKVRSWIHNPLDWDVGWDAHFTFPEPGVDGWLVSAIAGTFSGTPAHVLDYLPDATPDPAWAVGGSGNWTMDVDVWAYPYPGQTGSPPYRFLYPDWLGVPPGGGQDAPQGLTAGPWRQPPPAYPQRPGTAADATGAVRPG